MSNARLSFSGEPFALSPLPKSAEMRYTNENETTQEDAHMNIGIRLHDTAGTNLAEHLAAAREQGFTCVHIAMSKVTPGFKMADAPALLTDELAAQVKAELDKNGQLFAIEPVIRHIVSTPERCERVLKAVDSPNLKVILDAVNLLSEDNVADAKAIIADGVARLGKDTALLHIKDFIPYAEERGQQLKASVPNTDVFSNVVSCAAGLGDMDYTALCALAKERNIPMTLENTNPGNAVAAREHLEKIGASL